MGRALAPVLGDEGARVGLLDRNAEGLATLAAELEAAGVRCATAVADVSDRATVRTAIHSLAAQLGPVDLLVACAGITGVTLIDDLAIDETEAILRVNLLGVAYAIDAVLPGMLERRQGQIVALSSLAGWRGMPFSAAYSASKAGLAAYLESLRPALRRRGIRVSTIYPGFVRTPLMQAAKAQPPMRLMEPEEAACYILKAILRRRREYSFPWSTSLIVGLLRWLPPAIYDWMMSRAAANIPNLRY
jgi:short-subunit dehydrogenase